MRTQKAKKSARIPVLITAGSVAVEMWVEGWLVEDHQGHWVGRLRGTRELLVVHRGRDSCELAVHRSFGDMVDGRTSAGEAQVDYFRSLYVALAEALGMRRFRGYTVEEFFAEEP